MITGKTKLLGVMGHPITHSLSPVMHNAALAKLGIDAVYVPLAVAPTDLPAAIAGLAALGFAGVNLTIPHKQAVMPLLVEVSDLARAVGAVNTIWPTERGWAGTNTDVEGFLAPLKPLERNWSQGKALILGNGGAARAVVAGCAQLGFSQIQVVGRDRPKLEAFRQSWQSSPLPASVTIHLWEDLPELLPQASLVVNTTPIGMHPHNQESPLSNELLERWPADAIAYDLIYTPRPTRFLEQAATQGAMAIDGLEMLIYQGAAAFQIWLGQPAPVAVMRQALIQHLG